MSFQIARNEFTLIQITQHLGNLRQQATTQQSEV